MTNQEALVILNAVPGLGNIRIQKLIEHLGCAQKILSLRYDELIADYFLPETVAQNIIHFSKDKFLQNEYNLIRQYKVQVVTVEDEGYPAGLKNIPDAPIVLYIQGSLLSSSGLSLAVVGSRHPSLYGLATAERFARELADAGLTIVSGMARGIDTAAHRGCLKAKGTTIAVLGCGLCHVYPPENKKLSEEIIKTGSVLSEFPMETPPVPYNFPRRNRIISGLSLGVLVVEAALKSGALITCDSALEQGKEVFAVPGNVDNPMAQGPLTLIKQGAKLVVGVEDILHELAGQFEMLLQSQKIEKIANHNQPVAVSLSPQEFEAYGRISDEPIHIDELISKCGFPVSQTTEILFNLELKRLVRQLPGKQFVRVEN